MPFTQLEQTGGESPRRHFMSTNSTTFGRQISGLPRGGSTGEEGLDPEAIPSSLEPLRIREERPLHAMVCSAAALADQSAKLRKMLKKFGAALEHTDAPGSSDVHQGLAFWQVELEDLAEQVAEAASEHHGRLRAYKDQKPSSNGLLRDLLGYLLNRSSQDAAASDLVDRLTDVLEARGADR